MSATVQTPAQMFFFGPRAGQLYGALDEAQTYEQRECGIVLCYPHGQEYVHAHRAYRHLARQLSVVGFPVLRFDYAGTGDSADDVDGARLDDWRDDIGRAAAALRDRTGVEAICLIGLRLGASIALEAAGARTDIAGLVLWDPVVTGQSYLADLADQHQNFLWRHFALADRPATNPADELLGFPLEAPLRDDLMRLNLLHLPAPRTRHTLVIESAEGPQTKSLVDHLRRSDPDVIYRHIPSFATWREDVDKGLVPEPVLRGIVAWASEVLP